MPENLKFNLAKKTFIFYLVLGGFISIYSIFNLIYGIILQKTTTVGIGAFSILGFILIPLGLYQLYTKNKAIITKDSLQIGKLRMISRPSVFKLPIKNFR